MAIISSWNYGLNFNSQIGASERLVFSNAGDRVRGIPLTEFQDHTIVTNDAMDVVVGEANNCRYAGGGQIELNRSGNVIELSTANVDQADCTLRIDWQDDQFSTEILNGQFYAYDGVDTENAPIGAVLSAFEHAGGSLNNSWAGSLSPAFPMNISDQADAASHSFYIGLSASPIQYGAQTGIRMRMEFDVA